MRDFRFVLFCLILMLASVGCGPVYRTSKHYLPPRSNQGRFCAARCTESKNHCMSHCHSDRQVCSSTNAVIGALTSSRLEGKSPAYISCAQHGWRAGSSISMLECDEIQRAQSSRDKRVDLGCDRNYQDCSSGCESSFDMCFRSCGGGIQEHTRCIANCDQKSSL